MANSTRRPSRIALTRLERDKKKQAQAALVERLVRMTPETLKKLTR